jgi:hypothetical protein
MPLTLLISKHRVMLTITGVYLARILVEIQEVVSTHSDTVSNL